MTTEIRSVPSNWRPQASVAIARQRAELLAKIRRFFSDRNLLEVETPLLAPELITESASHHFATTLYGGERPEQRYLMPSPELYMKRLLAAGYPDIYQITKALRNNEIGALHQPEFTMLEWYRLGFDLASLMDEVSALLVSVLDWPLSRRQSYCSLFEEHCNIDPLTTTRVVLEAHARSAGFVLPGGEPPDTTLLLEFLFTTQIEPHLGQDRPTFVYHFPAAQAALAERLAHQPELAARCELFYKGIELGNGFQELRDGKEQRARLERTAQQRHLNGLAPIPVAVTLVDALNHGLPACSGIAIGLDRLLMLKLGKQRVQEVLSFA